MVVSTFSKVYSTEASAKGRVTAKNKAAGTRAFTTVAVEGGWVVAPVSTPVEPAKKCAKSAKFPWLAALVARLKEQGCTKENLVQQPTAKAIRLVLNGKPVTWLKTQEYVDATLAAL